MSEIDKLKSSFVRPKHKKFALKWMEIGNATQAYREVYTTNGKAPADGTCRLNGHKLLKRKDIKDYIDSHMKQLETESIMKMHEIQESLTVIAREKDSPKSIKLKALDQLTKILGGYQTHITTENRNLNGEMEAFSDDDLDKLLEQTRPGYFNDEDIDE